MGLVNLVPGKVGDVANGRGRVVAGELALDIAALDGLKPGEAVDVAIRPENIRLTALASETSGQRGDSKMRAPDTRPEPGSSARAALASEASGQRGDSKARAKITNHVFLGNISEYYATLPGGQVLRVQTHPLQHFAVGEEVAVEVDAAQCSVFRRE
jgi:iron(III) transport system ATP-binding protein